MIVKLLQFCRLQPRALASPSPAARSAWRIITASDGARYRLDEPADLDRLSYALSDQGLASVVGQLWRRRHKITN